MSFYVVDEGVEEEDPNRPVLGTSLPRVTGVPGAVGAVGAVGTKGVVRGRRKPDAKRQFEQTASTGPVIQDVFRRGPPHLVVLLR